MKKLLLAIVTACFLAAPARADFLIACEDYYPEPEAPMNTLLVGEVIQSVDGMCPVKALHCFLATSMDEVHIFDGAICQCNVARGYTPECAITIEYNSTTTIGRCVQTYPPDYYGGSPDGAWLKTQTVTKAIMVKHGRVKNPRKHKK